MKTSARHLLTGDVLIPNVVRQYPSTRTVLDKYGLKGCGGPDGPHEPLRVFARAHDVDLDQLLEEMSAAVDESTEDTSAAARAGALPVALEDVIYRRFFIAALIFVLTMGATWGTHLLAGIGKAGSFAGASVFDIQAHAQAQVYGWMALVIMGFAYQAFPRFWHTSLANPGRANSSFWLMVGGIVASVVAISCAPFLPSALPIGVMGGACELTAAALFVVEIMSTFKQSKKPMEPYIAYAMVAATWFLVGAALDLVHTWALILSAKDAAYGALATRIDNPLRDIQFHGLAFTMILGVSLRTLPHIFGLPKPSKEFAWLALAALTAAVTVEVCIGAVSITATPIVPLILLSVTVAAIVEFKLWRKFPEGDRSEKFIKAAWIWLVVSLFMLLFVPLYNHAYLGAVRHAITVGFISLMIIGYASKVTATLNGFDTKQLTNLLIPFLLINLGCSMRVLGQALTTFYPAIFPAMAISGALETTGIAIWAWHIFSVVRAGQKQQSQPQSAAETSPRPDVIQAGDVVADVLDWYPETTQLFIDFGFRAATNPVMRRTVARQVTLQRACDMHNIDAELFVAALNYAIRPNPAKCVGCTGTGCGGDKPEQERCH